MDRPDREKGSQERMRKGSRRGWEGKGGGRKKKTTCRIYPQQHMCHIWDMRQGRGA